MNYGESKMSHDGAMLATAIREAVSAAISKSTLSARKVAEFVCDRNPELVMRHGRDLTLHALTNMARREIKRWTATGTSASEQFCLPDVLRHVVDDLPPAVWVPQEDGDGAYRTFNGPNPLTCAELDLAIASLDSQIAADTKKCAALKEVRDFVRAAGASPGDAVLNVIRGKAA